MQFIPLCLFLFFLYIDSSIADERLKLKILKHQPCTAKFGPNERIRFPSLAQAPLLKDTRRGEGCYMIKGPVTVKKPIVGNVQIYAEVKFGAKSVPQQCENADSNGCGGVGSCVYCDPCTGIENIERTSEGLVQIQSAGEPPMECEKGIKAGNYSNIWVSFCLPTKAQVIKAEKIDESTFNDYIANGRAFYLTLYVFAQPINGQSTEQIRNAAKISNKNVIGCHKIAGTVREHLDE